MSTLGYWIYQPYKWLVVIPTVLLGTAFSGGMGILLSPLFGPRWASRLVGPTWGRLMAWVIPMRVEVEGLENLVKGQSYVMACNHVSMADIPLIYGWLPVEFKWVIKMELRKVPAIGPSCHAMGHIFVDRSNSVKARQSLVDAKAKICNGVSVMFFPEGTRSADGSLLRFKKGAFRMAHSLELPVLPITLLGTHDIVPSNTLDIRPGICRMIIHAPIPYLAGEATETLLQKTHAAVAAGMLSGPAKDNVG